MASRITVHGRKGDADTKRIIRELRTLSLDYQFRDEGRAPDAKTGPDALALEYPRVEIDCAGRPGRVTLVNPPAESLRQTLYAEEVLGITSFWI